MLKIAVGPALEPDENILCLLKELKKIETEHKAIQTEMDAVQKVIQKNIETTYKTFG